MNVLIFCLKSATKSLRKKPVNFLGSRERGITFDSVCKNFCSLNDTLGVFEELPW